jgi:acetylornithine deacetylase
VQLRGRVLLQSVVGEEDGGLGTFATLRRGHVGGPGRHLRADQAPARDGLRGALTFRCRPGRSVHASARLEGVDAFDEYVLVHAACAGSRSGATATRTR